MKNKPLKILFDANPLVNGNKSGVGYYTQGIIQILADNYPTDVKLVGHYFSFLGRKDNAALPTAPNISYVRSRIIPGKILSITRRLGFQPPLELFFRQRGDIALFTNFVSLPSITRIPTVVAVHDLCYIDVPAYVSTKNRNFLIKFVPRSIENSTKIITISESTKNAIVKNYAVPSEKIIITPIPPGAKTSGKNYDLGSLGINRKFILFVGNLEPRKNVINLVKAYGLLSKEIQQVYQLVLAGGVGWYMDETMDYISELQHTGINVITTGYVSDEARAAFYEHASLFVLPSHYEGFGMPLLEAMNYGVPTAASDIPVFHEVAHEATAYFDKDKPKSIATTITKILTDTSLQQQLKTSGSKQVKNYDWRQVAAILYNAIRDVS